MLRIRTSLLLRVRVATTFLGIVALLLFANDQVLRWAVQSNPTSRVNWIFQSPTTQYDVAILGSSLLKEGLDPTLLEELTDQRSIQLSWGGRGLSEQALYLELFLKHHGCKILLLELHPFGLKEGVFAHPLDEFRYISHLDEPVVNRALVEHYGIARTTAWRFIPMWAMAQFSSQIGWHDLLAVRRGEKFDPNVRPNSPAVGDAKSMRQARDSDNRWLTTPTVKSQVQSLQKIIEVCEQYDVQLFAAYPPMYLGTGTQLHAALLDDYRRLLGETPILVAGEKYTDDPKFFQDAHHLNQSGSIRFTHEVTSFLEGW